MKIREKSLKIRTKSVENLGKMCKNLRKIALYALILQKWRPKSKCTRVFFLEFMFLSSFSGKLGEIWASLREI